MNALDYAVVGAYLLTLLAVGFRFRTQHDSRGYFLGDRKIRWIALALSAMATQLGAISFVSAPAFVGIREGGGLTWLTYELGVPLAILLILFTVAPKLYGSGVVSIYEYIERRFGRSSRLALSITFQLSRGLASAVSVYAVAIILESGFDVPFWQSIVIVGVMTALYSIMGGMKAVVFTDALQMVLIVLGIVVCLGFGLDAIGGIGPFVQSVDTDRLQAIKYASLGLSGDEFGLAPMIFGGIVLYASYYGCDQTQAQRFLAASSYADARRVLLANGFLRFPITLAYCLMGLVIGTLALNTPAFLAQIPADEPDRLIPVFLLNYVPHGAIGLVFVGLLAAAMSSLSSAVNSLAAVTVEDFGRLAGGRLSQSAYLRLARGAAVGWGLFMLVFSSLVGTIAPTVIEAINKVGSLFYGPILAMFLLAALSRRVTGPAANTGLAAGLLSNLYLWLFMPQVFWFWWNFIGFAVSLLSSVIVTGLLSSRARMGDAAPAALPDKVGTLWQGKMKVAGLLVGMFAAIIAVSLVVGAGLRSA